MFGRGTLRFLRCPWPDQDGGVGGSCTAEPGAGSDMALSFVSRLELDEPCLNNSGAGNDAALDRYSVSTRSSNVWSVYTEARSDWIEPAEGPLLLFPRTCVLGVCSRMRAISSTHILWRASRLRYAASSRSSMRLSRRASWDDCWSTARGTTSGFSGVGVLERRYVRMCAYLNGDRR